LYCFLANFNGETGAPVSP